MVHFELETFENQKRGTRGKKGTSNSSTDNGVAHCVSCNDHDTLLMTTQKGIAYGLRAFQIPTGGRTAKGVPIPSVLPVKVDDVVTSILPVDKFSKDEYCALVTEFGWIKKTPLAAFENLSARGLIIASLDEGDTLKWCLKCTDDDDILIGSTKGLATRFEAAKLRPTGRTSRGVRSMRMKDGDTVADMNIISSKANKGDKKEYILVVTANGYGKRVNTCDFSTRARGGVGVIAMKFKPSSTEDKVSCLRVVSDDCEILATTSQGIIVRQEVKNISVQSRTATGVRVQKVDVDNCDSISSISIVPKYEEQDVY